MTLDPFRWTLHVAFNNDMTLVNGFFFLQTTPRYLHERSFVRKRAGSCKPRSVSTTPGTSQGSMVARARQGLARTTRIKKKRRGAQSLPATFTAGHDRRDSRRTTSTSSAASASAARSWNQRGKPKCKWNVSSRVATRPVA